MQYRTMQSTGDKLSALGYGCMRFPTRAGGSIDEKKAEAQMRLAIEQGVNYFDTAWPYHGGKSEAFVGKVLAKDGLRDRVKLATKLPVWLVKKREDMERFLNSQLEALQTDHIDYYLLHSLDGSSWQRIKEMGALDFLDKAQAEGKIIHKGFSFHGARDEFRTICDEGDWSFCQIQYNLLDEYNQAGTEGLEYAASKGLGIIIMEPLRGGVLAGKLPKNVQNIYDKSGKDWSNAEWALRWIWNRPEVSVVLSGMGHQDQVKENLNTAETALPHSLGAEELERLKAVGEEYNSQMKVGCTACQYCIPCPAGVDIPRVFSFYNQHHMFSDKLTPWGMYMIQLGQREERKSARASQCIDCGKCVKHCPQKIDIPTELKKVKRRFEGPAGSFINFMATRIMMVEREIKT